MDIPYTFFCSGGFVKFLLHWGYILTLTKVLSLYHSWIHPSIILLYLPSPIPGIVSTGPIFSIYIHVYIVFPSYSPSYTHSLYGLTAKNLPCISVEILGLYFWEMLEMLRFWGTLGDGLNTFCMRWTWVFGGRMWWFEYEMFPIGSCVEGFTLNWWYYFRKCVKLRK
jgi:hypothetical protein